MFLKYSEAIALVKSPNLLWFWWFITGYIDRITRNCD